MRVPLRNYQLTLKASVVAAWLVCSNVLAVSATGSGKTVLFADIVHDEPGATCVIAHRQFLVSQISLALARNGIRHRVIGSKELARACTAAHMADIGCDYVDVNSKTAVASVDTLIGMDADAVKLTKAATYTYDQYIDAGWTDELLIKHGLMKHRVARDPWFDTVKLWVMDEAHHILRDNKWGRAVAMFKNARGLGVTAETERADGYGLGANNDGVFHDIVVAPGMREIINMGFLTDYRVVCPKSDVDYSQVDVTASGELSMPKLRAAVHKSGTIVGDVVASYLKYAKGKLGITFAVDVEAAREIAKAYNDAGIPAEVVTSKTPEALRWNILKRFAKREILQLVNVDLFGEGFDLPAIEVVSMVRKTESFNLYKQQFGRALRLLDGKTWALIIDHVGNVIRHGLPDKRKTFTLDRRERRSKSKIDEDTIPMTVCDECSAPYARIYKACPFCGHCVPTGGGGRSTPAQVDGDMCELTQDVLARMRGDAEAAVDISAIKIPYGADWMITAGIKNAHARKCQAQIDLRSTMELWAGWQRDLGHNDSEIYRMFYLVYGTDMMSAQTLAAKEATSLRERMQAKLTAERIVALI